MGLTGITIPSSVRTIGVQAFSYCTGLDFVAIPEGVRVIDEGAFLDAELSGISVPKSVTSIGYYALNNTDDDGNFLPVKKIKYAGTKAAWENIATVGEFDDDFSFRDYLRGASMEFGEESGALSVTLQPVDQTIALGDTLTLSVRAEGEGLTYQWYYKKAGQTSWSVWKNRTHASETVTPNATWDGIQLYCEIKDSAGHSVTSEAATITVHQPAIRIINQPESRTIALSDTLTLSVEAEGEGLTYQWYYKKAGQTSWSVWSVLTAYTGSDSEVIIPDGVKEIGDEAFQYASMTSVIIPDSVTKIGERAFMYCSSLDNVIIPSSVTSIGKEAFSFCSALKTVRIPSSVTKLNDGLFRFCNRLTSVNIPDSVTSIGEYAFGGCSALTSVTIPDSVTRLSGYAFWSCTSLSSVKISRNVPEIGEAAFLGWSFHYRYGFLMMTECIYMKDGLH